MRATVVLLIMLSAGAMGAAPAVPLRAGMVISSSVTIRPGTHRIASAQLEKPAIVVRGSNITVDFNDAELVGSDIDADPDTFAGLGILVDGGENVTLRNARVRGFKVGLLARNASRFQVAYNSVTHGGDGLFLWAGQSTMDTGQGGCNDNVFVENDFSHAPANGIETTFSRNTFYRNRVEENWHGVWGGYSYNTVFAANRFSRNTEGIAIEHGQNNVISANTFDGDETAIHLWQNPSQDPDWGYPKHRDTRSHGYNVLANAFANVKTAVRIRSTADVTLENNTFDKVDVRVAVEGESPVVSLDAKSDRVFLGADDLSLVKPFPGGVDATIKAGDRRGREFIIVDEWGPYDWKSPKLWPAGRSDVVPLRLRVLGPHGEWRLVNARGAKAEPERGKAGDLITVTPLGQIPLVDFDIRVEYRGGEVIDPRGRKTAAGQPYQFGYSRYFVPVAWKTRMFVFDDASDPVSRPDAFAALLKGAPAVTESTDRLDYMSGRSISEGLPRDRVALSAEGEVTLDRPHDLLVISDDGVRIWAEDRLILDRWNDHESILDRVRLDGGRHRLRVEYYDRAGFAELRVQLTR